MMPASCMGGLLSSDACSGEEFVQGGLRLPDGGGEGVPDGAAGGGGEGDVFRFDADEGDVCGQGAAELGGPEDFAEADLVGGEDVFEEAGKLSALPDDDGAGCGAGVDGIKEEDGGGVFNEGQEGHAEGASVFKDDVFRPFSALPEVFEQEEACAIVSHEGVAQSEDEEVREVAVDGRPEGGGLRRRAGAMGGKVRHLVGGRGYSSRKWTPLRSQRPPLIMEEMVPSRSTLPASALR